MFHNSISVCRPTYVSNVLPIDEHNAQQKQSLSHLNSGVVHRRSRNFLWGALFFPKKLTTFLVVALEAQTKTTKITTPTVQTPNFLKNGLLLCLGEGCTYNFPWKFHRHFFSVLGVHVHPVSQCSPWLRLWRCLTFSLTTRRQLRVTT